VNKLSNAMTNLQLALESLVRDKSLRKVKRTIGYPLTDPDIPCLYLKVVRYWREGNAWRAEVFLGLVTRAGQAGDDEANIDLACRVDQVIAGLMKTGTAGAVMDGPVWEPWEWRPQETSPLVPVGSIGSLKLSGLSDPLLT